jgi:hypothetical protein
MGRLFRIKIFSTIFSWVATLFAIWCVRSPLSFALGHLVQFVLTPLMIYVAIRERLPALRIFPRLAGVALAGAAVAVLGRAVLGRLAGVPALAAFLVAALGVFAAVVLAVDGELRRFASGLLRNRGRAGAQ